MDHSTYLEGVRAKIRIIAESVIRLECNIPLAARMLRPLLREIERELDRQDYIFFVAVDSETDHLPTGPERQYWDPHILEEKDREIARHDALDRPEALEVCKRILEKLR